MLLNHETTEGNGKTQRTKVKIVLGGTENPGNLQDAKYHKLATCTMEALEGTKEILRHDLVHAIRRDIPVTSEYKQIGTYRQGVAVSFIQKFLMQLSRFPDETEEHEMKLKRESTRSFQKPNPDQPDYDEVERPIAHVCSAEQGNITVTYAYP